MKKIKGISQKRMSIMSKVSHFPRKERIKEIATGYLQKEKEEDGRYFVLHFYFVLKYKSFYLVVNYLLMSKKLTLKLVTSTCNYVLANNSI